MGRVRKIGLSLRKDLIWELKQAESEGPPGAETPLPALHSIVSGLRIIPT